MRLSLQPLLYLLQWGSLLYAQLAIVGNAELRLRKVELAKVANLTNYNARIVELWACALWLCRRYDMTTAELATHTHFDNQNRSIAHAATDIYLVWSAEVAQRVGDKFTLI